MKVSGAAVKLYGTQAISESPYISCLPPSPPWKKFEALGSPQCPESWIIPPRCRLYPPPPSLPLTPYIITLREGVKKKNVFFRTLSQTMGRWGSKVLNFLVKITIQLFLLQTSRNVLKHILHKWGGHIWPFHDDLRPQKILTLTH